jgi:hypothetical protein
MDSVRDLVKEEPLPVSENDENREANDDLDIPVAVTGCGRTDSRTTVPCEQKLFSLLIPPQQSPNYRYTPLLWPYCLPRDIFP